MQHHLVGTLWPEAWADQGPQGIHPRSSYHVCLTLHTVLPRSLTSIHSDLAFAFASTTSSPLSRHGHKLILFASFIEGILGSQATIHAAVSAYVSDCTSDGSRAHIFSRFSGVSYVGFSIGPALGAFLIRHPLLQIQSFGRHHRAMHSVTAAFGAAILFSAINLLLILIIPESLDKAKQRAAKKVDDPDRATQSESSLKERLLSPLAIFAPRNTMVNGRMREDWSMPWLAAVVLILYLAGVRNLSILRYYRRPTLRLLTLTGRLPSQILICGTRIRLGCRTGACCLAF
jgi:MFS family permease